MIISSENYVDYLNRAAVKIRDSKDYVSELDAATGDGDHWVNLNLGFEALTLAGEELRALPIFEVFKRIGMLMMSRIGGSSGILYGGAYLAAAKAVDGKETLDAGGLCLALSSMVEDMMARGKAEPGCKTMIDSLYPAVEEFKLALESGEDDRAVLERVKSAAEAGAERTKQMEARKGRASYMLSKGVGHLDPGAVTMSCQLCCLCDYLIEQSYMMS